jgi:hypothetical protein
MIVFFIGQFKALVCAKVFIAVDKSLGMLFAVLRGNRQAERNPICNIDFKEYTFQIAI